jgi:hypothetical protein
MEIPGQISAEIDTLSTRPSGRLDGLSFAVNISADPDLGPERFAVVDIVNPRGHCDATDELQLLRSGFERRVAATKTVATPCDVAPLEVDRGGGGFRAALFVLSGE